MTQVERPILSARRAARAGFTLLELMAVILIISILGTFLVPKIVAAVNQAEVTACQANLRKINEGLIAYRTKYSTLPRSGGVDFFASLVAEKVWDADQSSSRTLICPAVDRNSLAPAQDGLRFEDWFKDLEQVDGSYSSYAGPDIRRHPIRKFPNGSESDPVVADDNDPVANHGTTLNVLWANSTVMALELVVLQREGQIPDSEDIEFITVGPDSPVKSLQQLTLTD